VATLGLVPPPPGVSDVPYHQGTVLAGARTDGGSGSSAAGPAVTAADVLSANLTVQGLPLIKPPYSRITAINLDTGDFRWQVPFGATPPNITNHSALKGLGLPPLGRPGNNNGSLVTKTLLIIGEKNFGPTPSGQRGAMLRAYDKTTGQEVGSVYLPAPQTGSPMTYMLNGQQHLVVAISGGSYTGDLNSTLVRHDRSRDDEGGAPGLKFENALKVSNLSFNFGDKRILDAINLTINKGDVVGIIGKSGSGKTTLMNLLLGLYAPREGQIQVDEVVLDESTFKKWHRTIGLVPQNLVMIEGTIEENIVFSPGPLEVDHFKLTLAIERSGLKGFIESLPMGLHTPVSESALTLSGGQRQRIAIARALYHSNKFLLFDEATSSLDNEIISVITDSIANLAANGSTILLITHQPVLLKCCTRVYQLEQGAISLVGKEKYEASA
jgi:ABC-type multidrug transport system ATPase subunit